MSRTRVAALTAVVPSGSHGGATSTAWIWFLTMKAIPLPGCNPSEALKSGVFKVFCITL